MESKILAVVATSIFMLSLIGSVSAADVAMVVKDVDNLSNLHENRLKSIVESMGHNVNLIDVNSIDVDYSEFDLIIIAGRPPNTPT